MAAATASNNQASICANSRANIWASTRANIRASSRVNIRALVLAVASCAAGLLASGTTRAADIYDAAVQHSGRTADDQKRDQLDHPAEILRLTGIKPGMRVADFMAADGYYSELLSYVVGPKGHVLLINNPSFDRWSNNAWQDRIAHNRLPNVEHQTVDLNHMDLADGSLDAILVVKVYHDLYWVDAEHKENWPDVNAPAVLDKLVKTLKPGGTLLLVDHSSKPGAGTSVASSLHRIDEAYALHDFESRGLKLVTKSEVLRRQDDPRTQISYKQPALGKTDRFVMVFRKPG
jgi:predicted methyltransferase